MWVNKNTTLTFSAAKGNAVTIADSLAGTNSLELTLTATDGKVKLATTSGLKILAALDEVSGQIGATPAQVSLAWLMAKPAITAPIASATSLDPLKDLLAATRLQLTERAVGVLDAAGA